MYTAIVTTPNAFLYENPVDKRISDELLSGWTVKIQKQQNQFLKITTYYGYTGWLDASSVRRIPLVEYSCWNPWDTQNMGTETSQEGCPPKNAVQSNIHLAILCRGITDIQKEPTVQSNILTTLFMGSTVVLIGTPQDGWQNVRTAEGTCGYVPSISLLHPGYGRRAQVQLCPGNRQFPQNQLHPENGQQPQNPLHPENGQQPQNPLHPENGQQPQNQLRSAILHYAKSYLGTQYRWGGKTHAGIDCSGLAFMSYYMCGILIYRDAAIAEGYPVREIPFSQIQPADLLYFPGHVALYLGNDKFIHSAGSPASFGCVINSLNPLDPDYRKDLADSLTAVGSVF